MAKKTSSLPLKPSLPMQSQPPGPGDLSPELAALLEKVSKLLGEGDPEKALTILGQTKLTSHWIKNAMGVCQLRLGNAATAVSIFRGMAMTDNLVMRSDVPTACKTNYATALLVSKNVAGCLAILAELKNERHPAVHRLMGAIQRWKSSLSLWQKFQWYSGSEMACTVPLDFPAGDLE